MAAVLWGNGSGIVYFAEVECIPARRLARAYNVTEQEIDWYLCCAREELMWEPVRGDIQRVWDAESRQRK